MVGLRVVVSSIVVELEDMSVKVSLQSIVTTYVVGSVVLESVDDVGIAVPSKDALYNTLVYVLSLWGRDDPRAAWI